MNNYCISLHGIAQAKSNYAPRKFHSGGKILLDYTLGIDTYKNIGINKQDVYFHTYYSSMLNENRLIKNLSPIKYNITKPIIPFVDNSRRRRLKSRIYSIKQSLKLIDKNNYNYIISTRFDLKFKQNIKNKLDEKFKNITFGFYCEKSSPTGHVDDNFIIIPINKLDIYIDGLNHMKGGNFHNIGLYLQNKYKEKFDVLINNNYVVWGNPLYDIIKPKR